MKLNAKRIQAKSKHIKVKSFDRVDSTNTVALDLAISGAAEGVTVTAISQTAGKGRLGRSFLSQKGGVYFSVILRPQTSPEATLFITTAAAVAACYAIEAVSGKKCEIKWVNDIYINNKKVCGILTEGCFCAGGSLDYAVLGVGINLFALKNGFPDNLPLADCVFNKSKFVLCKTRLKERVIAEFANKFFEYYKNLQQKEFIKEYQQRSFLTGKKITYTKDGDCYEATVVGIDDNARLVVKAGEDTKVLSHGEIQIVGMEQFAV